MNSPGVHDTKIQEAIRCFKNNDLADQRLTLPITDGAGIRIGELRCVDRGMSRCPAVVRDMTDWRNRHMSSFLSQFTATEERTRNWLENLVIPSPDRILFVVVDRDDLVIGNIGICSLSGQSAELDNVLRGRVSSSKNLMFHAMVTLLGWIFDFLGLDLARLHVFSTNLPAIVLYSRIGFTNGATLALSKVVEPDTDTIRYSIGDDGEAVVGLQYLEMTLPRERFYGSACPAGSVPGQAVLEG